MQYFVGAVGAIGRTVAPPGGGDALRGGGRVAAPELLRTATGLDHSAHGTRRLRCTHDYCIYGTLTSTTDPTASNIQQQNLTKNVFNFKNFFFVLIYCIRRGYYQNDRFHKFQCYKQAMFRNMKMYAQPNFT